MWVRTSCGNIGRTCAGVISQCEQKVGKVWTHMLGVNFLRKGSAAAVFPEETPFRVGHSAYLAATCPVSPLAVLLYSDGFPLGQVLLITWLGSCSVLTGFSLCLMSLLL